MTSPVSICVVTPDRKYLHGSKVDTEGEDTHFRTYMTALRLTVALVIKMNDDFCLAAAVRARAELSAF